jgi:NADPH-dependent 2,4-dienoyl-CoA reductase/sulfur reductase-like enzyme/peroxiredoxin family protein/TusA-related sulfurtransferase/rhodanese-related sulfurtransferase
MSKPKKIIIVGGVAGGASAAARLRRMDEFAEITIIERGPDVSFANCGLPYHIGGEIEDRSKLAVQTPASLEQQLAIKVRPETEATAIDRENKTLKVRTADGNTESLPYDKLILSPGASPLRPPLPGIDLPGIHTLRNLQDMDRIKDAASQAERLLVIGAGFIGLEMAEQLVDLGKSVHLIELADQVLPQMDAEMTKAVEQELLNRGVDLILGDGIKGFAKTDSGLEAELNSGDKLSGDLVILSIGVRPESGLAKEAGLELGQRGHVKVNANLQTSDPDIYAVGDVCEGIDPILGGPAAIPLGGPANRQGRCAADHIVKGDHARPYPGSIGTAIVRVFDIAAGVTGHSEKRLQQMGVDYEKTIVTDYNHASYFPGATHLTIKVLWEAESGRILGGQANGYDGVDKRLDVLATAIRGKLAIEDLSHLELAYAPPFGAAKDPINTAGFSGTNIRDGLAKPIFELDDKSGIQLLDARPAEMARLKPIPGATNIPYPELRSRMGEIDKSRPVAAVCALGKMSYFASRILQQHGYDVRAHVGGWKVAAPVNKPPSATPSQHSSENDMSRDSNSSTDTPTKKLDATGLACPGPIMRVRDAAADLPEGGILEVSASDAGFLTDFPAFCKANAYECLGVESAKGIVTGRLRKVAGCSLAPESTSSGPAPKGTTAVVFSGELDRAMAAFVIANGAIAMGGKATLFFTFWGLNVLRKNPAPPVEGKDFMDKMFGMMLPTGPDKLPLSNMHMAGMGTAMMKQRMAAKDLPNLPDLMQSAIEGGVRLVACTMSMDAMGIKKEELIDGVELGGVAEYLGAASETHANLFI